MGEGGGVGGVGDDVSGIPRCERVRQGESEPTRDRQLIRSRFFGVNTVHVCVVAGGEQGRLSWGVDMSCFDTSSC